MAGRDVLFLGGLGVPAFLFAPWFFQLKLRGYNVHVVPNSFTTLDPVSTFTESFRECATQHDSFDVIGVSYGGNAALYGLYLYPDLRRRVRTMVMVCVPLGGIPILTTSARKLAPGALKKVAYEMAVDSEIATCIRTLGPKDISFNLHYIYHERDWMAPVGAATLTGVGTPHRLAFKGTWVPRLVMHQAACIHPGTLSTVLRILCDT